MSIFVSAHNTVHTFTAAMGSGGNRAYTSIPGPTVLFPVVLTNIGGGYNPTTSKYTCPVTGVFFFSVAIMSRYGYLANPYLVVDGVWTVRPYADGREGSQHGHSSNMMVMECNKGQKVWVEGVGDLFDDASNYSTFTGILLHLN